MRVGLGDSWVIMLVDKSRIRIKVGFYSCLIVNEYMNWFNSQDDHNGIWTWQLVPLCITRFPNAVR